MEVPMNESTIDLYPILGNQHFLQTIQLTNQNEAKPCNKFQAREFLDWIRFYLIGQNKKLLSKRNFEEKNFIFQILNSASVILSNIHSCNQIELHRNVHNISSS